MKNRRRWLILFLSVAAIAAITCWLLRPGPRASGPMPQQVYVWQQSWTPAVQNAVAHDASGFARLVLLQAEVTWQPSRPRPVPRTTRVHVDDAILRNAGVPVGIALRIGTYSGPFAPDAEPTTSLVNLAAALVQECRSWHVPVQEFQIDFDCPSSRLDGYKLWIDSMKRRLSPLPVTITALPAWLRESAFAQLAATTDGYVLQVHSPPRITDSATSQQLCDPRQAARAVERAGRLGIPFRVALPTYSYSMAFDNSGKCLGIAAEGPRPVWPADAVVREVGADANELATLVRQWTQDRPAAMTGIIWYRLPNADDELNWAMPTLLAVRAGRTPVPDLRAVVRRESGLHEIILTNQGDADASLAVNVELQWTGADLIASDAIGGFEKLTPAPATTLDAGNRRITLRAGASSLARHLRAGQQKAIGWLRLSEDKEVHAHVTPVSP